MKSGSIRDNKPFPSDALSPAGGGAFLVESDVILEGERFPVIIQNWLRESVLRGHWSLD